MPEITGYRELNEEELELINQIKAKSEEVGELVKQLQGTSYADGRWTSIGMTHLQQGFMALVRAIARPTTF